MIDTDLLNFVARRVSIQEMKKYPSYIQFIAQYHKIGGFPLIIGFKRIITSTHLIAIYYILHPVSVNQYNCSDDDYTNLVAYLDELSKSEAGVWARQLQVEYLLGVKHV